MDLLLTEKQKLKEFITIRPALQASFIEILTTCGRVMGACQDGAHLFADPQCWVGVYGEIVSQPLLPFSVWIFKNLPNM